MKHFLIKKICTKITVAGSIFTTFHVFANHAKAQYMHILNCSSHTLTYTGPNGHGTLAPASSDGSCSDVTLKHDNKNHNGSIIQTITSDNPLVSNAIEVIQTDKNPCVAGNDSEPSGVTTCNQAQYGQRTFKKDRCADEGSSQCSLDLATQTLTFNGGCAYWRWSQDTLSGGFESVSQNFTATASEASHSRSCTITINELD